MVGVFGAAQHLISTAAGAGLKSDEVLSHLVEGLHAMRFVVETGKSTAQKIRRPVLFGEQGAPKLSMDIDAFHDEFGIVLEVEAGRAWNGNAVYRDLIRSSLILDASYLALAVPVGYAPEYAARPIPAYGNTRGVLEAIYASQRLKLPFAGVLLIGY